MFDFIKERISSVFDGILKRKNLTPELLEQAQNDLKKALLGNKPIICELMLDHNQEQMPKAINKRTPDGKSEPTKYEDMYPFLSAKEINQNMLYKIK